MNTPASVPRPMYWSIRREIWENRSIYLAPLIVAAVVLFGSFIATIALPKTMRAVPQTTKQQHAQVTPFQMAPAPIMLTSFLVGLFYCLDALYGERRDRSILFWKSLPVSDRTTVLSKAAIPLLVLPSIAYILSVVVHLILLVPTRIVLLASGLSASPVWTEYRFFDSLFLMGYGLAVHALWFAPIYAYVLLVSAWARRAVFLWAVLPPLVVVVLEHVLRVTTISSLLQYRVMGAMRLAFGPKGGGAADRIADLSPGKFLSSPSLWLGLIFAAACLAAAVRLRRNREPI